MSSTVLLKVILLGDCGVGKSSLMQRFVNDKFDNDKYHTIGVEFLRKEITVNGNRYLLQIWDTAGQERYRSLRTPFYRGADICVLTFSFDNPKSFQNLEMWRQEFMRYSGLNGSGDDHEDCDFPFIVFGNKCDLDKSLISEADVRSWCKKYGKRISDKVQENQSIPFPDSVAQYRRSQGLNQKLNESYSPTEQSFKSQESTVKFTNPQLAPQINASSNPQDSFKYYSFHPSNSGIPFLNTSAKESTNVELGFVQVVALWEKINGDVVRNDHEDSQTIQLKKRSMFNRFCC